MAVRVHVSSFEGAGESLLVAERRCSALRLDGHPCRSPRMVADTCCFFHSPTTKPQRIAASSRGGKHRPADLLVRPSSIDLATSDGMLRFERAVLGALIAGRLRAPNARAALALAREIHSKSKPPEPSSAERLAQMIAELRGPIWDSAINEFTDKRVEAEAPKQS